MQLTYHPFTVRKRYALTISRGTTAQSTNIWVKIAHDGIEGWGEASPFSTGSRPQHSENLRSALADLVPILAPLHPLDRQSVEDILAKRDTLSAVRAAIDTALHDWLGKKAGLPLWRLWGLNRDRIVLTSGTVGISAPEAARARTRAWLQAGVGAIKVKLGSPEGIEADRAMFEALRSELPPDTPTSIDANGGWSLEDAISMSHWLSDRGVSYLEQPLPPEAIATFPQLYRHSALPIFADESCWVSPDLSRLADRVHGINIKLMKCGGLSEARRTIDTARSLGIQVMFGCYSDSVLANTAMTQLAPLADYLDLDSHLNLTDDPFVGASIRQGRLLPNELPGLGVTRKNS